MKKSFNIESVRTNFESICEEIDHQKRMVLGWPKIEEEDLKQRLSRYIKQNSDLFFDKNGCGVFEIEKWESISYFSVRKVNHLNYFFYEIFNVLISNSTAKFNLKWIKDCKDQFDEIKKIEEQEKQERLSSIELERKRKERSDLENLGDEIMALKKEEKNEIERLEGLFEKMEEINQRKRLDDTYITPKELYEAGLIELKKVENVCQFCSRSIKKTSSSRYCLEWKDKKVANEPDCNQFLSFPIKSTSDEKE
jgi:hypothetical protein